MKLIPIQVRNFSATAVTGEAKPGMTVYLNPECVQSCRVDHTGDFQITMSSGTAWTPQGFDSIESLIEKLTEA